MARWWKETLLLGALLGACGGRAGDPGESARAVGGSSFNAGAGGGADAAAAAGTTDGATAGSATAGGAATSHAGSSALAGAGSTDGSAGASAQTPVDCMHATPLQQGGGYEQCNQGMLHRPSAGECKSSLPRAKPDTPLVQSDCQVDSDCTASKHGFCAYGACQYGCVTDAECPSDQACFCGADIGSCVLANCHSDADCSPNLPCVAYLEPGFALPQILACESPADECLTTPQCNSLNPRVSCKFQVDHRICYQDPVG